MEKSLDRFLIAQQNFYHDAYTELKSGKNRSHWMPFAFLAAFMACPKALKSYFSTSLPIVNSPYYILQFTFLSEYDCTSHSLDRNTAYYSWSVYCIYSLDRI